MNSGSPAKQVSAQASISSTPGATLVSAFTRARRPCRNSEFPFYLEPEWNDRVGYEELRARNAPMYCYVQGMESLACLALQDGQLYKIGVQSFPG
jgi:hypothetical protein